MTCEDARLLGIQQAMLEELIRGTERAEGESLLSGSICRFQRTCSSQFTLELLPQTGGT